MAVVCKNKKSLRDCFSSLDSNSRDEYKFFKAICRSLDYDEVRSFYGMYVPNDKITTTVDSVSVETLREKFPFTDFTTIEKVMEQQRTWTSCYDVLSSLVSSHGTVLVNCQEFSIDSFGWPSLQESALKCCRQGNSTYQVEFDWTLCELDASEFQECVQTSHEDIPETTDFDGLKTVTTDMNKSWEVIEVINGGGNICIKTETLPLAGSSYRDVLALPAAPKKVVLDEKRKTTVRAEWKPRFEIVKIGMTRVDRIYGTADRDNHFRYEQHNDQWIEDIFSSELEMYVRPGALE